VRPKISAYIQQLRTGLADRAISTEPRSARSNGGIERSTTISQRPVVSLLSGPAAGIAGALHVARQAEWNNADLVTLDVGGTSADIGVIRNGAAVLSSEEHIADFPVLLPTVAVSSIGAGGGSIIWVDDAGALKVGPRSLGADPAPACYGHQKDVPALTDAFLLAGWLGEAEKLGGKIRLNAEFARSALASVATALNCSIEDAADGAISIGIAMMASETMRVLARRGVDAPEFRLVAFGGAGPLVGGLLAEEVHISSVLIPPAPGALSALGAALADVESDFVHPVYSRISELDAAALSIASKEMERRGEDWLVGEGQSIPLRSRSSQWSADMRYDGQGYDVSVPINREWLANDDLPAIAGAFHQSHKQTYGHASLERQVWLKELRLHVIGSIKKPTEIRLRTYGSTGHGGRRTLRIGGQEVTAAIYPRDLLDAKPISGPAVIDQLDSTTLVPPGWTARAIGLGSLLLERTTA
jgi:N-methylhydantoinase A